MKTKTITLSNKILATLAAAAAGIFILSTGCSGRTFPENRSKQQLKPALTLFHLSQVLHQITSLMKKNESETSSDVSEADDVDESEAADETETADSSDTTDEGYTTDDDDSESGDVSDEQEDENSGTVPAETTEGSTITHNGITWTFSKTVTYGRFVTGDYWVVGPVTVEEVSPSPRTNSQWILYQRIYDQSPEWRSLIRFKVGGIYRQVQGQLPC